MAVPVKYLKKTRTEPALKAALLSKMETKPVARITIKELCEMADVYRSTFYCHYNDVESLYAALEKDIFSQVDKAYDAYVAKTVSAHEYCKTLCDMVRNGSLDLSVLFRLDSTDSKAFVEKLVDRLVTQVKAILAEHENAECMAEFIVAGGIGCVVRMSDCSTDDIADAILGICKKA